MFQQKLQSLNQYKYKPYNKIKVYIIKVTAFASMNQEQYGDEAIYQSQPQINKGQFRQEVLQQYYRYLNLLKKTNNLCKDFNSYRNLNDHDFQDLALVGWIFQVENNVKFKTQDGKEQLCMIPTVYSNIKDLFKNNQETHHKSQLTQASNQQSFEALKRSQTQKSVTLSNNSNDQQNKSQPILQPHIKRQLLLLKTLYTKYFVKAFNQILKQSKEFKKYFVIPTNNQPSAVNTCVNKNIFSQIEWIYAFTGLKLAIESDKLYFLLTQKTKIIALDTKFYTQVIENMQKSVGFVYSYLSLSSMPKYYDSQSIEEGYSLLNLQTQASIIEKISFFGILKEKFIDQAQMANRTNLKDKQIVLIFLEDGIHPSSQMLGLAKLLIKYSVEENEEQLINFFKIGFIYLITEASVTISDNISILYKPKQKWKDYVFEINIQKSPELNSNLLETLPLVQMSWMKLSNVNRNIIKFRVDLIRCEAFYGKILCTNCKRPINSEGFCTGYCDKNQGQLILWIIALVSDESTYAEISMEKNEAIKFFEFTAEHLQEIRQHILAQNSKKMVRLFDKFTQVQPNHSSQSYMSFQRHIIAKFISKKLIGVPKFNLNQSFAHQLTQEQKIEFQQSLQTSREYLKKNKVHFNGYVKKIQKNTRKAVPFIKVIQVLFE